MAKLLSLLAHRRLPRNFCKRPMLGAHGHWTVKLLRCTCRVLAWLHNTHQFTISDIIFSMILMITLLYIFSRICLYFYKDINQNNSVVVSSFSSAGSISHQRAFFVVPLHSNSDACNTRPRVRDCCGLGARVGTKRNNLLKTYMTTWFPNTCP